MKIAKKINIQLLAQQKTIALAESCTGGLLANRITDVSGSSKFLKVGIIAYSNEAKIKILKVKDATIKKFGAVSEQTALEMAIGVRKIFKTDFGISITGIAGPEGGTKKKPVGLVYIAISLLLESLCLKYIFHGSRLKIKSQACNRALHLLNEFPAGMEKLL